MRQGVQGELSQGALCLPRVVVCGVFPLPIVSMPQGWGGPVSPQECARWHLARHSERLIVRYLFPSALKQTLALMDVIAWDRTSAGRHGENLQDAA